MANCADEFEHSSLIVQQMKIYYVVRIETEPQQLGNDIDNYFCPLVEDLKVLWYNHGLEV
jgi:hypothetical protein